MPVTSNLKTNVHTSEQSDKEQSDDRRNNVANTYSWWHWRRSNENTDKKTPSNSPDKNEAQKNIQSIVEEKTDSMDASTSMITCEASKFDSSRQNSLENDGLEIKNDDSISSEIAEINSSCNNNEKFRKSLRLTSEEIVSAYAHNSAKIMVNNCLHLFRKA